VKLRASLVGFIAAGSLALAGCAAGALPTPTVVPALTTPGDMAAADTVFGPGRESGHTMLPVESEGVPSAQADARGAQPLGYQLEGNIKVFNLTAEPVRWTLGKGIIATAWTYNGTVPGPLIRVTEGDRVRVVLRNSLPAPTTVHWHGMQVPTGMDGVPDISQPAIKPGATLTYEFVAGQAGTFWYHSQTDNDLQVSIGLFAPLIVDPKAPTEPNPDVDRVIVLNEWRVVGDVTVPAMPMTGMDANFFTVNGKFYPDAESIDVKRGQRVRLRLLDAGQLSHALHLHGVPFKIVAADGYVVPEAAQLTEDTVTVAPGESDDVEFVATEAGRWALQCNVPHHTTNDGSSLGGLMMVVNVS
jgi:FtsP/CotA-like multicopper oxidase with cupredoxin domain